MSIKVVCDFCGKYIAPDAGHHVLSADCDGQRFRREWTAHYHDGDCWDAIEDALDAAIEASPLSARAARRHGGPEAQVPAQPTHDERRDCWKRLPLHERERIVLEALGDERRTNRELSDAITRDQPDLYVYRDEVANLTRRLCIAGELIVRQEQWRGRPLNRYQRNAELSGPIAELQRQLDEHDGTTTGGEGNG